MHMKPSRSQWAFAVWGPSCLPVGLGILLFDLVSCSDIKIVVIVSWFYSWKDFHRLVSFLGTWCFPGILIPGSKSLGSKITADGDCSHEIKRCLLLGRQAMTNLDSILKSIDITFPTKVQLVKAMVFPVVRYGCESWTVKKAERWRTDAFELWCWRRLLRVPWTARRSNQSILKEISPEYSLEGLMLKLQYFGHPDVKNWLIGKDPDARKEWRHEEKGMTEDEMVGWHHQLDGYEFERAPGVGDGRESLAWCSPWGRKELDMTEQLNWTKLNLSQALWVEWLIQAQLCVRPLTCTLGIKQCCQIAVVLWCICIFTVSL